MSNPSPTEEVPLVNTLPPEILSAIFLYTRTIRRFKRVLPFQVSLSHVCRQWRQVAVSTPHLWSTMTLFSRKSVPYVQEWLARSGGAPIDLRIDLYDADQAKDVDAVWIKNTCGMFIPHAHQLQSLFVLTYHEVNVYHILQLFEYAQAPLLERLCVHIGGAAANTSELAPFDTTAGGGISVGSPFGGVLPRLSSVELQPLRCIPLLENTTTLRLLGVGRRGASLNFNRLQEILQGAPNLVTFSLHGAVHSDVWPMHRDRPFAELPKLRHLELIGMGATNPLFLLFFGAPNLESLYWHIDSDNYHIMRRSPQFKPGVGKFPLLKYLTIERQLFDLVDLTTFTQIFPTATHVFFSHPVPYRISEVSDLIGSLSPGWTNLQVLAVRMISVQDSEQFAPQMRAVIPQCPKIQKLLVDTELLSYLYKTAPDLRNLVELEELSKENFPDYWLISRQEDTPDRL